MKHRDYWRQRFEQLEESQLNKGVKYYRDLEQQYQIAISNIEKEILVWYSRFASNNKISLHEAKKSLGPKELKELSWTVKEYIKYGQENSINQMWMNELENASAKAHITRLETLKLHIQNQIEVLYSNEMNDVDNLIKDIYTNGYYHTAFEIQKGLNVGFNLMALDTNKISKIVSKPWASDGLNFSDRIWGKHRPFLVNEIHKELTQSIIRGEDPQRVINIISEKFNVSKSQAGNLVMTESAFFASESQKDCYNDLNVEGYEVVATLDLHTSSTCRGLDGKVFEMKDYEVGVTAPPFHNYCRTVTAPYFEDDISMRAARGSDGKTYYIDSNMKYSEWYDKYVRGDSKEEIAEKKIQNNANDKKQYEKYKLTLGNQAPKSVENFQELKYNKPKEWDKLKIAYKDQNIRNHIKSNELTKEILIGKQGKHILGHNNYIEGRSYMSISVEELQQVVNEYAGTGHILRDSKGQWNSKELIEINKILGVTFDNEGNARETKKAIIHYSNKGTHVVPTLREVRK